MPRHLILKKFCQSEHGNIAVIAAMMTLPLMLAVGMAVDYSAATTGRAEMQNALDAGAFAALALPVTATVDECLTALQGAYTANGGLGTATINGDLLESSLGASLKVTASYDMPMAFMGIVGQKTTKLSATSSVSKPIKLTQASFKLDGVTGAWDKTVMLMGRSSPTGTYQPLMKMTYVAKNIGGWGDTVLSVPNSSGAWIEKSKIACTSKSACTKSPSSDGVVEMANMDDIYLQMDISAKVGKIYWWFKDPVVYLKSNDPLTSDQMFVEGKQTPKGTKVNMIQAIGCNETWIKHRWEDGGGWEGAISQWEGTDFRYQAKGACSSNGTAVRLTN